MKLKKLENIRFEQCDYNPYILLITAEVDGNYYFREKVGRFSFADSCGYLEFETGKTRDGYTQKREYRYFQSFLNYIFKCFPNLYWDSLQVEKCKQSAIIELQKREEDLQRRIVESESKKQTKQIESNAITETAQDNGQTFTAFNRSFPSYSEAYKYCISSDFDPAYILTSVTDSTKENAITEYHNSNGLNLDLQLFGKDSNSIYTKEGVHKWGIGKHLRLLYIVETTKTDNEVESMHFSNIHRYEHKSIQSAIETIASMQRQRWYNISLDVQLYNYKNDILIEDIAYDIYFTSTTEEETRKDIRQLQEQTEHLTNENQIYRGFISKYKAEKALEKYTSEQQIINKDSNGLYWYEMLYRPLSPFCQPKGHISYDDTIGKHGIIAYSRPLTENELVEYELIKWKIV